MMLRMSSGSSRPPSDRFLLLVVRVGIWIVVVQTGDNLQRHVPCFFRVVFKMRPHSRVEIGRDFDWLNVQARHLGLERRLRRRAAPEGGKGLGQRGRRRDDLGDAVFVKLALDEFDKHVRGHGVQFDALFTDQESGLFVGRAIDAQPSGDRVVVALVAGRLRVEPHLFDVGEVSSQGR